MDVAIIPGTEDDRRAAFLAFSSVIGGGIIAYEAARAIRDGELLGTDEVEKNPKAGLFAMAGGIAMLGVAMNETAKEVGWKPLLLGGAGITAFVMVARALRR
jgi:hypothetical protein